MPKSPNEFLKVVVDGTVLTGFDLSDVKIKLAGLIQRDVEFAGRLLGGRITTIRSGVDRAVGERYLTALREIGVAAFLQPETLEIDSDLNLDPDPAQTLASRSQTQEHAQDPKRTSIEAQPSMASKQSRFDVDNEQLSRNFFYESFIGDRQRTRYLQKFTRFDQRGTGLMAGWNWAAFLCGPGWALYRKMYVWFFVFWAVTFVSKIAEEASPLLSAIVLLVSLVAFGAYADALYHRRAKARIASIPNFENPTVVIEYLRRKGGVQTWVIWAVALIPILGILAAMTLPAYQDYVKRKNISVPPPLLEGSSSPRPSLIDVLQPSALTKTEVAKLKEEADVAMSQGNYASALLITRRLADAGHAAAQFSMGNLYSWEETAIEDAVVMKWVRETIPQNYAEALKWYRMAADQDYPLAQKHLGAMYATGQGVLRNYVEAHKWYSLADKAWGHLVGLQSDTTGSYISELTQLESKMAPAELAAILFT